MVGALLMSPQEGNYILRFKVKGNLVCKPSRLKDILNLFSKLSGLIHLQFGLFFPLRSVSIKHYFYLILDEYIVESNDFLPLTLITVGFVKVVFSRGMGGVNLITLSYFNKNLCNC